MPLKPGTAWFYAGLFLYCAAFVCHGITLHNYATTPENEAITKGMYRISRNPLYLFYTLMFLGLVMASLSLPLFFIWMIYNISTHLMTLREERYCLEHYTDSYRVYMQEVPKVARYRADTEGGSSGSPVLNNEWNLVALHHAC